MAIKVNKGKICNGTISKNTCHQEYYFCGKFHGFTKSAQFLGPAVLPPVRYLSSPGNFPAQLLVPD